MKVSQSVKLAGIFVALIALYFLISGLFGSDTAQEAEAAETEIFSVLTEVVSPESWRDEVIIRGRTEAERKVIVRAETSGKVAATPAELGELVDESSVLCQLNVDARRAQLAEARAALAKAQLDYDAAVKLNADGFRSETSVAAAKATRDQAAAAVERASLDLEKKDIKAPFEGVFDKRHVEVGDFMGVGDPCATVIQRSPFLVVGAISERDVGKISKGDRGAARLATGETIEGTVRLVAKSADPATRTFDVELEIPNEDGALRDGVTAEFTVFAEQRNAHRVPRSALVLNDNGDIGVRTVGSDNIVGFTPIRLIGETASGVWVGGLEQDVTVIVRGQEYVSAGQTVRSVPASQADKQS
ncbi:efflux RND transporter periplasmic adaptor subunit [Hyphococcus flavus]|uniref:Efflux RND transporter periplasmic adaptor subunit n=1 Tax=Hyphococcus flavus TaxID=1866326 RepID=A0AAE9ZC42_9PROT|nr:efflux RND transporter periplasmic adaptor subunit [Hyphococcus flavus]WDI32108.1 efflux RND transporter periplasmic adaptor subunit [Hyphococcus flavus]